MARDGLPARCRPASASCVRLRVHRPPRRRASTEATRCPASGMQGSGEESDAAEGVERGSGRGELPADPHGRRRERSERGWRLPWKKVSTETWNGAGAGRRWASRPRRAPPEHLPLRRRPGCPHPLRRAAERARSASSAAAGADRRRRSTRSEAALPGPAPRAIASLRLASAPVAPDRPRLVPGRGAPASEAASASQADSGRRPGGYPGRNSRREPPRRAARRAAATGGGSPGATAPAPASSPSPAGSSCADPLHRLEKELPSWRGGAAAGREVGPVAAGAAGVGGRATRSGDGSMTARRAAPARTAAAPHRVLVATSSPGRARSTNPTPSVGAGDALSGPGASFSMRTRPGLRRPWAAHSRVSRGRSSRSRTLRRVSAFVVFSSVGGSMRSAAPASCAATSRSSSARSASGRPA